MGGSGASDRDRVAVFNTGSAFLRSQSRPLTTPVSVIKEGQGKHHPMFKQVMKVMFD